MSKATDFFICHVADDKKFTDDLNQALLDAGFTTWYNDAELGDNLMEAITEGLKNSTYGIVVLSRAFFRKGKRRRYSEDELNDLVQRERNRQKLILPVWHGIDEEDIEGFSPQLAARLGIKTLEGLAAVMTRIIRAATRLPARRRKLALESQHFSDTDWVDVTDFEPQGLRVHVSYTPTESSLPRPCLDVYKDHLARHTRAEQNNTEYFFNGASYRVDSIAAFRRAIEDERGEVSVRLGPSDYFRFLSTCAVIDQPMTWEGGAQRKPPSEIPFAHR